jgi:hypothetical protein
MTGNFTLREGKWFVSIRNPRGGVVEYGGFDTREEAAEGYKAEVARMYPLPPPPVVDPARHHSLDATGLTTDPTKIA